MSLWRIDQPEYNDPETNELIPAQSDVYDDHFYGEPGAEGFLDVILAMLDGTMWSATYLGPSTEA